MTWRHIDGSLPRPGTSNLLNDGGKMCQIETSGAGRQKATLALLPAAGIGMRARPLTSARPKCLLEIDGEPLIARAVRTLRDGLGIRRIVVIVAADDHETPRTLEQYAGVDLTIVRCEDPGIGLARGMLAARAHLNEPFVMLLPDEVYEGGDHAVLPALDPGTLAICGALPGRTGREIERNYSVVVEGTRILRLTEKPCAAADGWLGCGTFVFDPAIFDAIERAAADSEGAHLELIEVLDREVRAGARVDLCSLAGEYVNVNTIEDWRRANDLVHGRARGRVSVIVPALDEEESIAAVVADFLPHVHEVIVVDNRSQDRTAERARAAGARVLSVAVGGYGATLRHGLDHAEGELLVLVEADHSFRAADLQKLLTFLPDHELVLGTRTTRSAIQRGAAMGPLLRLGNIVAGKLIEVLWWRHRARLTDVGCTYRALRRAAWLAIRTRTLAAGPAFAPELTIEALRAHLRVVEVPVSYNARCGGVSKHSGSVRKSFATAIAMLALIVQKRLAPRFDAPEASQRRRYNHSGRFGAPETGTKVLSAELHSGSGTA